MYFHNPSFLLSRRPHAAELRRLAANAVVAITKSRAKRILKGKFVRTSADNREKYNGLAGFYYSHYETEQPRVCWYKGRLTLATAGAVREHTIELLVEALKSVGAKSVLEVGCGDGNNLALIKTALPDVRVAGVDISDGRIAFAKKYHSEHGNDVELSVENATGLSFSTDEFDVVYSLYCLEHLPVEYPEAIREMLRVAKKKVVLIEPVAEYFGPVQRLYMFAMEYIRGLPRFLEKEGIDVESVELLSSAANWMNLGAMITLRPEARKD